jgi:hypothetical protein
MHAADNQRDFKKSKLFHLSPAPYFFLAFSSKKKPLPSKHHP